MRFIRAIMRLHRGSSFYSLPGVLGRLQGYMVLASFGGFVLQAA